MNGINQRQRRLNSGLFLLQAHQQPIAFLHLLQQVSVAHLRLLLGSLNAQLCQAVACHNLAAHIDRLQSRYAHHVAILAHSDGVGQPQSRTIIAVEGGQQVTHRRIADVVDIKFQHRVERIVGAGLCLHLRKIFGERLCLDFFCFLYRQLRFADIAIVLCRQREARIECQQGSRAVCRLRPCGARQAESRTHYI